VTAFPSPSPDAESDQWVPVTYGDSCIGFLMRKRDQFEAFTINSESAGLFDDEATAVGALFRSRHKRRSGR
jgi:hypothetical protein